MANRHDEIDRIAVSDGGTAEPGSPPVPINHIGLTVTDIDAAVEWYTDMLGFTVLSPPTSIPPDSGRFAELFVDIINEYDGVRQAHLLSANGVGFELFEYDDSPAHENPRSNRDENWQAPPGIHHFAVTHPNIQELIDRLEEAGGEQHSEHWTVVPDQPYELVYVVDPWGNLFEVYNRSYPEFFANQ